jgi:glycosidase
MVFDWEKTSESQMTESVHSKVLKSMTQLIELRRHYSEDSSVVQESILRQSNDHVLVIRQITEKNQALLLIFNMSEDRQWLYTNELKRYGLNGVWREIIQGKTIDLDKKRILLGPYEFFVTKM